MLQNGIDYTPDTATPRRLNTSAANPSLNTIYQAAAFAQRGSIDISKFIALLDEEGVTVVGGEPLSLALEDYRAGCWTTPNTGILGGPGYAKTYQYTVRGSTFGAVVKYSKNQGGRTVDSINISQPGDGTKHMMLTSSQLRRDQADAVLNKCDLIQAAGLAKIQRDAQENFNQFIESLAQTE